MKVPAQRAHSHEPVVYVRILCARFRSVRSDPPFVIDVSCWTGEWRNAKTSTRKKQLMLNEMLVRSLLSGPNQQLTSARLQNS
eukprot:3327671-Pleurochrysis_carterae.AAC.1